MQSRENGSRIPHEKWGLAQSNTAGGPPWTALHSPTKAAEPESGPARGDCIVGLSHVSLAGRGQAQVLAAASRTPVSAGGRVEVTFKATPQ